MKIQYHKKNEKTASIFDYTDSSFSPDELARQVAEHLRDHQMIDSLFLSDIDLYEKGAFALRQVILNHASLRKLHFSNLRICSYSSVTEDEYYFPPDLDRAVQHLCAILQKGHLTHIEMIRLSFHDKTHRQYEHFDMVEPATMRDLLLEEKCPFYLKEIANSLYHNVHLLELNFSMVDTDVSEIVKKIKDNIEKREHAAQLNAFIQGTHSASGTYLNPDIFKAFTLWWWLQQKKLNKQKQLK